MRELVYLVTAFLILFLRFFVRVVVVFLCEITVIWNASLDCVSNATLVYLDVEVSAHTPTRPPGILDNPVVVCAVFAPTNRFHHVASCLLVASLLLHTRLLAEEVLLHCICHADWPVGHDFPLDVLNPREFILARDFHHVLLATPVFAKPGTLAVVDGLVLLIAVSGIWHTCCIHHAWTLEELP